jgi:TorA maturation chaperone TorD
MRSDSKAGALFACSERSSTQTPFFACVALSSPLWASGYSKSKSSRESKSILKVPHQHRRVECDEVFEQRPPRDHLRACELFDPALV